MDPYSTPSPSPPATRPPALVRGAGPAQTKLLGAKRKLDFEQQGDVYW